MAAGAPKVQLEARGLAALRGERLIFRDLDLALEAGAALALVGPNGSGKTTLLRLLATLAQPAAGQVLWRGRPVAEEPAAYRRETAYVGHRNALKGILTVSENLTLAPGGAAAEARAAALAGFALEALAELPLRVLSAGQQRRTALARLLLARRALWLLDEPTAGLDAANEARLWQAAEAARQAGTIVVVATHAPVPLAGLQSLTLGQGAVG